jgi:hypothetical protein
MKHHVRRRFWAEAAMATSSLLLGALAVLWKDWIEIVFRVDPDGGSGELEWLIVATSVAVTIAFTALARHEWRRELAPAAP